MRRLLADLFGGFSANNLVWKPAAKTCGNCGKQVSFAYYFYGGKTLATQKLDAENKYADFVACLSCSGGNQEG